MHFGSKKSYKLGEIVLQSFLMLVVCFFKSHLQKELQYSRGICALSTVSTLVPT